MRTALELFANEGFHSTTISRIAKNAGISKGLMYNYFESKEALLKAILDEGFDALIDLFDPNRDGILEKHELIRFIEQTFRALMQNIGFWRFYFSVSVQPEVYPVLKDKIERIMGPMMKMLVDYFKKQGFDDPETEALLFGALMDGVAMDYVFSPDLIPIEKMKEAIIKKYCS